jgi:NAD(P)-dependent dehydrogenase (short-subunit alcohol dehydrogenase family)
MAGRLAGKVVLITGSTTGIGEATARLCVAEGARVMVHGTNEERAKAVSSDLGAGYVLADLGDPHAGEQIVAETLAHYGAFHAVVNNAAVTTRSNLETTDAAMFDRIIAVNLRAPLLIARAAIPIFRKQGGGAIVNIGSINALSGEPNLLAYSMAKGGLVTFSRNLANSLAHERIRVNHLNVGWVATPNELALKQREGLPPGWEQQVPVEFAPTGRILQPEEVAAHVVFWISDESAPANGVVYELEQYSLMGRNPAKAFG